MTTVKTINLEQSLLYESAKKGHITANAFFKLLDWATVGLLRTVVAANSPPGSPVEGEGTVIGASPAGAFSGFTPGDISVYLDGGWLPGFTPKSGSRYFDKTTQEALGYHATYGFFPLQDRWSSTEHWTGKFRGGTGGTNRVYSKTITDDPMGSTLHNVAHGISNLDLTEPITFECYAGKKSGTKDGFPFPRYNGAFYVVTTIDGTNVQVAVGADYSGYKGSIRITYRKTV